MSAPYSTYPERDPASCAMCGAHPDDCRHHLARRIQVACYDVLVAEAIVEASMVDTFSPVNVWAKYAQAKDAAGKPSGGAIIQRADLPRFWDVPVGCQIAPVSARRIA